MRKSLLLTMSLFVALVLAACGSTETEGKDIGSVDTGKQENSSNANVEDNEGEATTNEDAEEDIDSTTYDEVLLDDEIATVILKGIETEKDEIFGNQHNVKLEIENKTENTVYVQSREVSIDGFMVDDNVIFSETVAGGKKAKGELSIMAFDDELPELNENIEFKLVVIDEGFMELSSADVSIEVK